MSATPRIYVACLASYNAGTLHGEWFDLDDYDDGKDLSASIADMLAESPEPGAEEWAVHDHEGIAIDGEWPNLSDLVAAAQAYRDHPSCVIDWLRGEYPDNWASHLDDLCYSCADSLETWAEERCEDQLPESFLTNYIDWERVARDLVMDCSAVLKPSDGGVIVVEYR